MVGNEILIETLVQKNLNFKDLSNKTGIPYEEIKSIVAQDLKKTSIENGILIAKALNVEFSELIPELKQSRSIKIQSQKYNSLKKDHTKLAIQHEKLVRELTCVLWKHL